MHRIRRTPLLLCLALLLLPVSTAPAQPRGRFGKPAQPQAPPPTEFLGWDYAKLGYSLSPGEELSLLFRNNRKEPSLLPVRWELATYAGEPRSRGEQELKLEPGEIGQVPIPLPADFQDGAYFVNYSLGEAGRSGERRFHFDYRRPLPDERLNLNIVLIENMDAEGWTRMMLGPLAAYANVWSDWPAAGQRVDAALVIAETLRDEDPRLTALREYVERGGRMLLFGKPSAALYAMLPVAPDEKSRGSQTPQRLQTRPGGPWSGFEAEEAPTRYRVNVRAKPGSAVLAAWDDGSPAIVSWQLGKGQVAFVGCGAGQEWQRRASLEGADEMALRLLYWMVRGEAGVTAMLDCAGRQQDEESIACSAVRDRVLEGLALDSPRDFTVVSRHNVGRFGWLLIRLQGPDQHRLRILLGDPVAPLHPYFTKVPE